jgi:hypothetical protein
MSQYRFGSRPAQSEKTCSLNHPIPDFGGVFASDTVERTAEAPKFFTQIQILTDAVIDIDKSNLSGGTSNAVTAVTVKAGTILYGVFPRFKLASGSAIGYYGTD